MNVQGDWITLNFKSDLRDCLNFMLRKLNEQKQRYSIQV
jgi:hypothetical protein